MGGVPGPFSCYLALRGVKTLHLRMREHEKNAFEVAKFLNSSPHVERVIYPGIRSLTSQL
jgi:cystathionine beta-lyase/cystathionine gamma-synthase